MLQHSSYRRHIPPEVIPAKGQQSVFPLQVFFPEDFCCKKNVHKRNKNRKQYFEHSLAIKPSFH